MAKREYFEHETLGTGETQTQRAEAQGTRGPIGEVIASSKDHSVGEALDLWLTSDEGHCEGIMNPEIRRIGIEQAGPDSERWLYWTANTARSDDGEPPEYCVP
mmetsp:Transcript_5279/g.14792  ORF Transcript_5279/g.14792 Transcript_5279/m.14792 type:complete len:103 (+) Transcript_5279:1285-1593(+)